MLYRRLRGVYKLTDYQGFYFFANIFLFLGIAYFLRFIVVILLASGIFFEGFTLEGFRGIISFNLAFLAYTSSVSILYAIYSLLWDKTSSYLGEVLIHVISVLASFSILLLRPLPTFVIFQLSLLLVLMIAILVNYRYYSSGKIRKVYPIYLLLLTFWLLNLSLTFGLLRELRIIIYTLSAILILIICYKVLKKL